MQEDPVLLLYLICTNSAGQVSALPLLSPGTRHYRQHLLPSGLPNPHTGMGRCPSLCGHTDTLFSQPQRVPRLCQWGGGGSKHTILPQGVGWLQTPGPYGSHPYTIPSGHSAKQDQPQLSIFVFDSLICPFCRAIPWKS